LAFCKVVPQILHNFIVLVAFFLGGFRDVMEIGSSGSLIVTGSSVFEVASLFNFISISLPKNPPTLTFFIVSGGG